MQIEESNTPIRPKIVNRLETRINDDLVIMNSNEEESNYLLYLFKNHLFDNDYPWLSKVALFGNVDTVTNSILDGIISAIGWRVKHSETSNSKDVREFRCYCFNHKNTHNIIIHEDKVSSFRCAVYTIGNPKYVIILKKPIKDKVDWYEEIVNLNKKKLRLEISELEKSRDDEDNKY